MTTVPQPPTPTTVDLLVVLTRLETKLDAATIGLADHESRLRTQEQTAVTPADLEPLKKEIAALKADVETLKRGRWPLPAVGALTGIGGLVMAWQSLGR